MILGAYFDSTERIPSYLRRTTQNANAIVIENTQPVISYLSPAAYDRALFPDWLEGSSRRLQTVRDGATPLTRI